MKTLIQPGIRLLVFPTLKEAGKFWMKFYAECVDLGLPHNDVVAIGAEGEDYIFATFPLDAEKRGQAAWDKYDRNGDSDGGSGEFFHLGHGTTATIADVAIGHLTIQGLMAENGQFGVAVPQISQSFQLSNDHASRDFKALLGKGFQFAKWKTILNPKAVNVVSIDQFQALIRALDKKGNPAAAAFVDALLGLSLHQLFCDAFGLKFEAYDRQLWLQARLATKHDFRPLLEQLKLAGLSTRQEYSKFIWEFQTKLGIESGTRDDLDAHSLVILATAQVRLTTLIECGIDPWTAITKL